jgi:hypothetical protein
MLEVLEGVAGVGVAVHQHSGLGVEGAAAKLGERQRLLDDGLG